jgi:hypothetical protein
MNTKIKLARWLRLPLLRIVRRWKMRRLRDHKAATFLGRWDRACNRLWIKFQQKPRTTATMQWMDRNHGRLLRVCRNETRKLSPPNVTVEATRGLKKDDE